MTERPDEPPLTAETVRGTDDHAAADPEAQAQLEALDPATELVHETDFTEHSRRVGADMLGMADNRWPATFIDWDEAAGELRSSYAGVELGEATYYYHPPEASGDSQRERRRSRPEDEQAGVLPSQQIEELIGRNHITAYRKIGSKQIQPASLDVRLGRIAHRLQASFLPGTRHTVEEKLQTLSMTQICIEEPTVLERGCVYLVKLEEELDLPSNICARANPKSTTGRLDVFTRIITDHSGTFEQARAGYRGPLYAEIMPRTFPVMVKSGISLSQVRFVRDNADSRVSDTGIKELEQRTPLTYILSRQQPADIARGIRLTVNLQKMSANEPVAYRGRYNAPLVDMAGLHDPRLYWERIEHCRNDQLILNPGDFYILASRERVRVPPEYAAEMVPFDPAVGELRIHYAGFFDPGFGFGDGSIEGTCAVLEVRAHDTPFVIEHGQVVGRLEYNHMAATPDRHYGAGIGSSYAHQSLALSKQFRRD